MFLSLIGMSGSGKSFWSVRLAEAGFTRFSCDELIAEKLGAELKKPDGTDLEMGEWMGFPFEPQYQVREARYLGLEVDVLLEVLATLGNSVSPAENAVVDTTGSVIYAGEKVLRELKRLTKVFHFASPPEIRHMMLEAYRVKPRPVLWQGMYHKLPGESDREALARSYFHLLSDRENRYERLADVIVDYVTRSSPDFGVDFFLDKLSAG
jgi:hypothetical protein